MLQKLLASFDPTQTHFCWIMVSVSGVGEQSAAPGPSRKCHPLVRAVMLYLWRYRAQSTMVCSFVFWRNVAKFSVNCRLLNLPENHAAGPSAQLQFVIATTWWYQQSIWTSNNHYKQKTSSWAVSKLKKNDYKATTFYGTWT